MWSGRTRACEERFDLGAVPAVVGRVDVMDEGRRRRAEPFVHATRSVADRVAAASNGKDHVTRTALDEQGPGRDERGDIEVLERAEHRGQHLRSAHVPRHRVRGAQDER